MFPLSSSAGRGEGPCAVKSDLTAGRAARLLCPPRPTRGAGSGREMTIDVREAPHIREAPEKATPREFDAAEIGALAHLYRGEIYRSTAWRTRLDNTTNWAVVTTGIALTVTFSHPEASPLPLVIVGLLLTVFLLFEARRYRYFSVWRARARLLETDFYARMLLLEGVRIGSGWNRLLAQDYREPRQYISLLRALGRRLRRNYAW